MASMLEGGGKTPILPAARLEALGFSLCAYPLSLLGVSVRAMEGALEGLKGGLVPQPPAMPTFQVCGGAAWLLLSASSRLAMHAAHHMHSPHS